MPENRPPKPPASFDAVLQHMRALSAYFHGKQAFDSKGMAERIAARQRKRGNGRANVYRCPKCRAWHIGCDPAGGRG